MEDLKLRYGQMPASAAHFARRREQSVLALPSSLQTSLLDCFR